MDDFTGFDWFIYGLGWFFLVLLILRIIIFIIFGPKR